MQHRGSAGKRLQSRRIKELDQELKSGLDYELTFYTKTPIKKGSYNINFKVTYGNMVESWQETATKQVHKSRLVLMQYTYGLPEQTVRVEIDTIESEEQRTKRSFVGQVQSVEIKSEASFSLHECLKQQKPIGPLSISH